MAEQLRLHNIIEELVAQQLLQPETKTQIAETLTHPSEPSATPWFVSALIAISAWVSVILLLIFIGSLNIINSPGGAIVIGLLLIIATVSLHYIKKESLFFSQLALAFHLTGQILFIAGIATEKDVKTAALATWLLEIVLISFYQYSIFRFVSVLIATLAAVVLLHQFALHQGIHVLIVILAGGAIWYWINEARHLTDQMMKSLYQPLGYSFVIALQTILLLSILPEANSVPHLIWSYSTLGLTVLLLSLEYQILNTNNIPFFSPKTYAILGSTLLVALLLYQSPGIIASIIVLILGFQQSNRVLMGLAIIFLTIFLIAFYYHLDITLLMKSITLMSTGLALLILRFLFKYVLPLSQGEKS